MIIECSSRKTELKIKNKMVNKIDYIVYEIKNCRFSVKKNGGGERYKSEGPRVDKVLQEVKK